MYIKIISALLVSMTFAGAAYSEDSSLMGSKDKPSLEDLVGRVDLSIPDTPAFVALGVTPENVIRPGSARELALGLVRGIDNNGTLQTGIAIETAPYLLSKGNDLTIKKYRENSTARLLSRVRLSFATASGKADNDNVNRTAIAIRWTPWDLSDKRMYTPLTDCYEKNIKLSDSDMPLEIGDTTPTGLQPAPKEIEKAAETCIKEAEKSLWNAGSWDIGVANYVIDDNSQNKSGYSVWTSLALKLGNDGQFIVSAQHHNNLLNKDINGDGNLDWQNGYIVAARLRWGNAKAAILLEGSYTDLKYPDIDKKDNYYDYLIGVEHILSDNLWLQLAMVDRGGSDLPNNSENYISGQFRWAFSKKSLR